MNEVDPFNFPLRTCIILTLITLSFLLCAEGLSALIQSAVDRGQMEGVKICRGGLRLSHLFFADDSLIFCKATLEECDELQ